MGKFSKLIPLVVAVSLCLCSVNVFAAVDTKTYTYTHTKLNAVSKSYVIPVFAAGKDYTIDVDITGLVGTGEITVSLKDGAVINLGALVLNHAWNATVDIMQTDDEADVETATIVDHEMHITYTNSSNTVTVVVGGATLTDSTIHDPFDVDTIVIGTGASNNYTAGNLVVDVTCNWTMSQNTAVNSAIMGAIAPAALAAIVLFGVAKKFRLI